MTASHASFTITRHYKASPETVFDHWSDPDLKRQWFAENDGPDWTMLDYGLDFRIGGREHGRWTIASGDGAGGPQTIVNETRYFDIARPSRIVMAYSMAGAGGVTTVSLVTIELAGRDGGTDLRMTEQIAQLDGAEAADDRAGGWTWILNGLERALERTTA